MSVGVLPFHNVVLVSNNSITRSFSMNEHNSIKSTTNSCSVWSTNHCSNVVFKFVVPRASSISGSAAEFPDGLVDAGTGEKRKKIAGIDQEELVDPTLLADPDSKFCEFKGVHIHHKVYDVVPAANDPSESMACMPHWTKISFPMILLHGFGASVFSWNRVMKPLADATGSKVLAFDRPAFGLTSRVSHSKYFSDGGDQKPLNPYSMAFSVLATLSFIDMLGPNKAILVGHSAGCLVALNAYFEAPESVAALILVAPAIFAPLHRGVKKSQSKMENETEVKMSSRENIIFRLSRFFSRTTRYVAEIVQRVIMGMTNMLNSLSKKVLSAILRSAFAIMLEMQSQKDLSTMLEVSASWCEKVRTIIDKFGIAAIKTAWHDSKQISEEIIYGYTKPLRSKGWDRALVEYTVAMLLNSDSASNPPLAERLDRVACPVLVITGDNDRIVPSWNAERLSRAIPGSSFELIKNCGHLPHEEKVEEFVSAVKKFLQEAFGSSEEEQQLMHAVN